MTDSHASSSHPEAPVLIDYTDGVLTLTLNDPATGNLVDVTMSNLIIDAITSIGTEARLICLRGNGPDFCAGRKSPTPPKGSTLPSAEVLRHRVAEPALALYNTIKLAPVPTLAVIHGRAFGVGAALAAVCDITIAKNSAQFSIPELMRDIPPVLVMSALHDRVPIKTLSMLVYTTDVITAEKALQAGLISETVPDELLESTVTRWITSIANTHPVALRACKQYLTHVPKMSTEGASAFASHIAGTALSARE